MLPATRQGLEQATTRLDVGEHFEYFLHKSKAQNRKFSGKPAISNP
jgi:hypothetical protein